MTIVNFYGPCNGSSSACRQVVRFVAGTFAVICIPFLMSGCNLTAKLTSDPIEVKFESGPEITLEPADFAHSPGDDGNVERAGSTGSGTLFESLAIDTQSQGESVTPPRSEDSTASADTVNAKGTHAPSVTSEVHTPRPSYFASAKPGKAVTVSGLVGQVNGRPIFVDEVFEPIADQLAIWGREKPYNDFFRDAYGLIQQRLRTVVENKLLLAEAEIKLTPQQQEGLIKFLGSIREGTILKGGGTETGTNRQLQNEQGLTLDEHLRQVRRQILIREEVRSKIERRVVVTWRDVERYYRTHPDEFNPPASIQLRIIAVKPENAEQKEQVAAALTERQAFEFVADEYSDLSLPGGLYRTMELPDGIENATVTTWPKVNEAIRTLKEGDIAGPFEVTNPDFAVWVYVEKYEDGTPIPLFEAQRGIEAKLRDVYFEYEAQKYFRQLRDRGNYDDFDQMAQSLLAVALDRWAPPGE